MLVGLIYVPTMLTNLITDLNHVFSLVIISITRDISAWISPLVVCTLPAMSSLMKRYFLLLLIVLLFCRFHIFLMFPYLLCLMYFPLQCTYNLLNLTLHLVRLPFPLLHRTTLPHHRIRLIIEYHLQHLDIPCKLEQGVILLSINTYLEGL